MDAGFMIEDTQEDEENDRWMDQDDEGIEEEDEE
jgi:hypothetical protein